MTRKAFFSSILGFIGVAKAQKTGSTPTGLGTPQWKHCEVPPGEIDVIGAPPFYCGNRPFKKALNGQCPTCGVMAEPYIRQMIDASRGMMVNCKNNPKHDKNDPSTWWVTCDPPKKVPYGDPERRTRCTNCNAIFGQDAEK